MLAASLVRSRNRWVAEGVFERYWTKPSKKKGIPETKNPPKDLMSKLGPCTLTIEPHVFEITLYTVKEPRPPAGQVSAAKEPNPQRPISQSGPPSVAPSPPVLPKAGQHPRSPQPPIQQPLLPVGHTLQAPQLNPRPSDAQPSALPPTPTQLPPPSTPSNIQSATSSIHNEGSLPAKTAPSQAPTQAPDPVIQMLATKAASDHGLKDLMKIVASGEASSTQLKIFQGHIDSLTALLQARNIEAARSKAQSQSASTPPASTPRHANVSSSAHSGGSQPLAAAPPRPASAYHVNGLNAPHTAQRYPSSSQVASTPSKPAIKIEPYIQQPHTLTNPPPAIKAKGTPPPPKPEITNVVFQFSAGTGDRFLFPKHSILEYLPGGQQVIASFLLIRKGSDCESGRYNPDQDYYQPVTMRLAAHQPKTLEPLNRVVASQHEVRRHMDDIMDKMTRADNVYLAMRLPRDPDDVTEVEPGTRENPDVENAFISSVYAPPGSVQTRPKPQKPAKKPSVLHAYLLTQRTTFTNTCMQPAPLDQLSPEPWTSPGPPTAESSMLGRTRRGRIADPNKTCHICHTSTTSLWRKADIEGENVTGKNHP